MRNNKITNGISASGCDPGEPLSGGSVGVIFVHSIAKIVAVSDPGAIDARKEHFFIVVIKVGTVDSQPTLGAAAPG